MLLFTPLFAWYEFQKYEPYLKKVCVRWRESSDHRHTHFFIVVFLADTVVVLRFYIALTASMLKLKDAGVFSLVSQTLYM